MTVATTLIAATPEETGFFLMELKSPVRVASGVSTEPEVTCWYVSTAEEVERMGSTAVRYLIHSMLPRPYTLDCTQQTLVLVSGNVYTLLLGSIIMNFSFRLLWPGYTRLVSYYNIFINNTVVL